ncbi:hypothetical protein PMIN04_011510 [Paraphaeosphaeria minitans]
MVPLNCFMITASCKHAAQSFCVPGPATLMLALLTRHLHLVSALLQGTSNPDGSTKLCRSLPGSASGPWTSLDRRLLATLLPAQVAFRFSIAFAYPAPISTLFSFLEILSPPGRRFGPCHSTAIPTATALELPGPIKPQAATQPRGN